MFRKAFLLLFAAAVLAAAPRFDVRFSNQARSTPVDGRLLVVIAAKPSPEPRFQVAWDVSTAQVFGVDVDGWKAGDAIRIDDQTEGYPLASLRDLRPGTYTVQAVLNVYETVKRADGHTIKVPWDNGEGQQWNRSPGNLYSKAQEMKISGDGAVTLELTEVIPPVPEPKDTEYIRHFRMQSKMLSEFWGRPVFLSAIVLVPPGFDENTSQKYPVAFNQGHFPQQFRGFREVEPPADGPARAYAEMAYRFYQDWSGGRLPKMLIVLTQHPTPYYDDSYGVNSANMGPYGDALTKEFYPALEQKFRAIGEPWARVLFGGSTGGWMTLAEQVFYPDYFGGTWSFCPDPVDFHAFQTINVYKDRNAYFDLGSFGKMPKPVGRYPDGRLLATMESFSRLEHVLGGKGRSGGQMDAFHATFGPVGKDGYPAPLWDPATGEINPEVAKYWEDHYDLTARLKNNWEALGPRLVGKIHVKIGTKDTFYLEPATGLLEQFLESTKMPGKGPYYGGSIENGNNEPHCWAGAIPKGQTVEQFYLPVFADHMKKMAPNGADTTSWAK